MTQPSPRPTRKVTSGALAGALVTIGVWCVQEFAGVVVPAEVAAAAVVVVSFCVSYVVPEGA